MKNYRKVAEMMFMSLLIMNSCSKNEAETINRNGETYSTTFKMTDAPIDNANVEAVFVTVADVKVDGVSLEGFTKTTLELSSLINGRTADLGNLDLQAGSYSDLELTLDYDTDADGNAPGCYVATANGEKDKLTASATKISIADSYEIVAVASNEIVIDFDLRKTVREEKGAIATNYEFVSTSELSNGLRIVNERTTGKISGTANDAQNTSDKIVVYAYEKGTFNADAETQGKGESDVTFANAVTSSVVSESTNSFSLNFLTEGQYELIFVSYNQDDDQFFFNSLLQAESNTGFDLGAINITSALQLSTNVTITGTK